MTSVGGWRREGGREGGREEGGGEGGGQVCVCGGGGGGGVGGRREREERGKRKVGKGAWHCVCCVLVNERGPLTLT